MFLPMFTMIAVLILPLLGVETTIPPVLLVRRVLVPVPDANRFAYLSIMLMSRLFYGTLVGPWTVRMWTWLLLMMRRLLLMLILHGKCLRVALRWARRVPALVLLRLPTVMTWNLLWCPDLQSVCRTP